MLRPDLQAEIMLSFQNERRQEIARLRQAAMDIDKGTFPTSVRVRILRRSGDALISVGAGLQRLAGLPMEGERAKTVIGEMAS